MSFKWQQVAGSVDEKFPYLYLNCIETMSENEIILIVDGGGYKDGALAWLKDAVQEKKYQNNLAKEIRVFSLVDFLTSFMDWNILRTGCAP
jgi:predicted Rossmann-fold nucleotide-binding protein